MGREQRVIIPYSPRPQQRQIHELIKQHRFVVVPAHRRFGKTVLAINEAIRQVMTCRRDRPRAHYIAPTYRQGKAVAWDYLLAYSAPIPGREVNIQELRIDLPGGSRVQIVGADSPDALRGLYSDFAVLDEVGLMQSRVWSEVVRPMLADRQGRALFIGTPAGRNSFYELRNLAQRGIDGWALAEFKASDTHILPDEELAAARAVMSADEYAQEFEASFEASVKGAIYAAELERARSEGRVTDVPVDDALLTSTAWDLGVGDSTAIVFFQQSPAGQLRIVDYHEASGEGLAYYASVLERKGYKYGRHIAPHDIQVRELGTGLSRLEQARKLGIRFDVLPQSRLEDGIAATRAAFSRIWIDRTRCERLLDALQNYRWARNTRLDEFKPQPEHDWASHASDSVRYMCLGAKSERKVEPIKYELGWVV